MYIVEIVIFFFLIGIIIGSFLNVCIYRLPKNENIVFPPSHCPSCQNRLRPKDLIPVMSFLLLKGKCRYCGEKIHWRYPVIEMINGLGWSVIILNYGVTIQGFVGIILFSLSLVIASIDLEHYIIPDSLVLVLILSGIIYHIVSRNLSLINILLGTVIGFTIPFVLALISRGGMGGGDIKLCTAIGMWLGLPGVFLALFLSSFVGSIVGITLIVTKIRQRKEPIPFGPFLVLGFFVTFFFQKEILTLYWSLF
ncbi:MAG: prepilin peptidase [Clostridia bacterium]|nr:prepilin peptidase [Clostridia bacterium]MDD4047776.1 prepilin peptidase [Clostridia bacterium]